MGKLRWEDFDPASDDWCYKERDMRNGPYQALAEINHDLEGRLFDAATFLREMVRQPDFAQSVHRQKVLAELLACDRLLHLLSTLEPLPPPAMETEVQP